MKRGIGIREAYVEVAMTFLVQFIRFRRGVPEAIRTLSVEAADEHAALAHITNRAVSATWPRNTEALRVMDDGGRTVLQWVLPGPAEQEGPSSPQAAQ